MEINLHIPSPHLVPLPMEEETLAHLAVNYKKNCKSQAILTSPMGRGARQRGEGVRFKGGNTYA